MSISDFMLSQTEHGQLGDYSVPLPHQQVPAGQKSGRAPTSKGQFDPGLVNPGRRQFLQALGVAGVAAHCPHRLLAGAAPNTKPRVAAIVTEYRGYSHADVIVGRLLQGHILSLQETYWPRTQVVSMYVDQFPKSDLSRGMANQYGAQMAPSIEQALTLGTDQLAVDGVVIIGEHGDYPHNEKGQHMYPRRRFFEETVRTFEKTGKTAPVFNDKHLGFAWKDAKWMVDQARTMKFPLMAGSSLPTAWRKPDLEYPLEVDLEEGLAIGFGGIEAYGFHALETLQCMIERRRGGESGVRAVTCLEGDAVWQAARQGKWSRELLHAALKPVKNKPNGPPEELCKSPVAFLIEHTDGFHSSVVMLNGYSGSFGFAGKQRNKSTADATHFWLQEPEFGHFAYLTHNIETMILEQRELYPPERTLLTTGILDAVMTSRHQGNLRLETPWLEQVKYRAPEKPGRRARF
jgi:hypothetical protein